MHQLSLTQLQHHCAEQSEHYRHQREYDGRYCFELFRRAIVTGEDRAWEAIHAQYVGQVRRWVRHQARSTLSVDEVEAMANAAFTKFWQALSAEKFDAGFHSLGKVLQYLKMCTVSVTLDHVRRITRVQHVAYLDELEKENADSDDPSTIVGRDIDRRALLERVWALLNSDDERLLVRLAWLYDLTPAQIVDAMPDRFGDVRRVYRMQENIMRRLRRNLQRSDQ